ncbi:C-terminal helicase domain-containing protein [Acidiferrobacter sp.]|uniref:helicase-related protein n=1 Tax=Acidiferrobacter sp. TaxID=1872107 RepID=UPI00262A7194|nr:C-terminal helicase domain-containing protein [Acidiferrobacter sp.]
MKADEVTALVDGLAAQDAKAVIFSQWTRSHDIVIRRLEARGVGYVSFHGKIPSEKRPALVERFREDPDCRVFLSTDAGSTGLNLQNAATLINMDMPRNPAILGQRIARIHRMGQKRPVRVVNLVAKGTIEEGMLSVLAFKRSLSAGILDGGAGEVSLGGSRLNRFMKEVENVTGRMGEAGEAAPAEERAFTGTESRPDVPGPPLVRNRRRRPRVRPTLRRIPLPGPRMIRGRRSRVWAASSWRRLPPPMAMARPIRG